MKKLIFTLSAIAFSSFIVQAQNTLTVDDKAVTVKKIQKNTKASYSETYNVDEDAKKVVVKKAAYSGSTNTMNTNSKILTLTEAANSQKYKVTDKDPALSKKNKTAEKNKVVKTKVTKSKTQVKDIDSDDDGGNNNK